MSIEWEDPPPARPQGVNRYRYDSLRAACKANPKRWAVAGRDVKNSWGLAERIKSNVGPWAGPWEARVSKGTVWVRWMGDPE